MLVPRSPHAQAFAALRSAEEVVGWLDANVALHSLAKADQPVEVGACLIADAIESSTEAPAQLAGVQAALDDLAEQVRVHGPGSTPQELLDQINQVGGLQTYVVERAAAWHRACNRMWHPSFASKVLYSAGTDQHGESCEPFVVEWGDRSDVRLGGSLAHVLGARRGTPLMLCVIHQARHQ